MMMITLRHFRFRLLASVIEILPRFAADDISPRYRAVMDYTIILILRHMPHRLLTAYWRRAR